MAKRIACVGDTSDHGGEIISSNQDGTLVIGSGSAGASGAGGEGQYGTITYGSPAEGGGGVEGAVVAVHGAQFSCPIHGIHNINAVTIKTYHNGRLILTEGAVVEAPCLANITPPDRKIYIE